MLKHEVGGWIFDVTRKEYNKITNMQELSFDEQEWLNYGAPRRQMVCLVLDDNSFTQYLDIEELDKLYPYIGKNPTAIEVLYGQTK